MSGENRFGWYELLTTDTSVENFYKQVIGWGAEPAPNGMPYTLFTTDGTPVAGMMEMPEPLRAQGIPPFWLGYVAVANLDEAVEKATSLKAQVMKAPMEIPGVGRFAALVDPQGAAISLIEWANPTGSEAPPMAVGHVGWHELATTDWQAAFEFYSAMFGWQKSDAMDMGEMGTYQIFSHGDRPIGGMMNRPSQMPVSAWGFYVSADNIDAAHDRVVANGGTILQGPMEVPGGMWIVQFRDPKGAFLATVGPRIT
jgi:predicted enzyme related to lactoylglutathione lyase